MQSCCFSCWRTKRLRKPTFWIDHQLRKHVPAGLASNKPTKIDWPISPTCAHVLMYEENCSTWRRREKQSVGEENCSWVVTRVRGHQKSMSATHFSWAPHSGQRHPPPPVFMEHQEHKICKTNNGGRSTVSVFTLNKFKSHSYIVNKTFTAPLASVSYTGIWKLQAALGSRLPRGSGGLGYIPLLEHPTHRPRPQCAKLRTPAKLLEKHKCPLLHLWGPYGVPTIIHPMHPTVGWHFNS